MGGEDGALPPKAEEVLEEVEVEEDLPCSWEEVRREAPQRAQRGALGKENLQGQSGKHVSPRQPYQ